MKKAYVIATNIVSPLGFTTEQNFMNVQAQKTGLAIHDFDFSTDSFCVSQVDNEVLNQQFDQLNTTEGYTYSKLEKMCILSVNDALSKAQTAISLAKETLIIFCSTKGNIDVLSKMMDEQPFDDSLLLAKTAQKIASFFGFEQKPLVISNACVSGTQGILVGKRLINSGLYKNVIVVGGDLVSKFTLSGFKAFNALSNEPCKPFDQHRKGVNLGEGAATIILSENILENQENIAVTNGFSSNDATHISAPSRTGEGLLQALNKIAESVDLQTIDFVSAHGTATLYNDEMEAQAFSRAGLNQLPMHSLKGYFGHTLGAAGVLETVMGVASLHYDQTVISRGFEQLGTTQIINPIQKMEHKKMQRFLKTSSGFGGCNAAILLEKC